MNVDCRYRAPLDELNPYVGSSACFGDQSGTPCFKHLRIENSRKSHCLYTFPVLPHGSRSRNGNQPLDFEDFSPKVPTPTAGLSDAANSPSVEALARLSPAYFALNVYLSRSFRRYVWGLLFEKPKNRGKKIGTTDLCFAGLASVCRFVPKSATAQCACVDRVTFPCRANASVRNQNARQAAFTPPPIETAGKSAPKRAL